MSNKPAWQEMGLNAEEYEEIKKIIGREPNYTETGIFAVMWSEHASYKNSRPVLKNFPTTGKRVLQGPGENAGIVDIGDNQSVVFKVESHNHPSALEPYQGAATGIGGIIRDIFTMGARPIACLNSLRFGELKDNPKVKWLFEEVVAGIAGYGNCIGIPTVAGEVYFDDSYEGNPLVNAMCVGLVDNDKIAKGTAAGVGNAVMVIGARTGRDGIHGATFASEDLTEESEEKRSAVQVGDPFMEKLLLEACLELIKTGYLVGIQDMGAAGLTCSTTEMAGRGDSGMEIDVSLVPVREAGMTPYEIMLSESQERMLAVPHKGKEEEVRKIFAKWGLNAVVIGHVTDDGLLTVKEKGDVVAQVPIKALTDDAPTYIREESEPTYLREVQNYSFEKIPMPADYTKVLSELLSSPNIASKEWVYRQYDHQVMTNTVVKPGSDAAVLRVKGTKKGLAMTIDCNARYCYLNPVEGGKIAVAEAARNLVCSGGEPLAVTDCLNYGNPYKPEVFWTFHKSIDGMAEACRRLDTPVIGGNVSFYNETRKSAVYPTPTIGMVGLVEDVDSHTTTQGFKKKGDIIILIGENKNELGGSEYLKAIHGVSASNCPEIDLDFEARVQKVCLTAIREGLLQSAHDCSEGGLAVALAECCISGEIGARVNVDADFRTDALLFGETQSRIIVSLKNDKVERLAAIAKENNVPTTVLGMVEEANLDIMANDELISAPVFLLEKLWRRSIECAME